MKIEIASRESLLAIKGSPVEDEILNGWNIISICTPAYPPKNLEEEESPFSRAGENMITLKFHDAIKRHNEHVVLFNEEHAEEIARFVESRKSDGKGFFIHCTAGRSRSFAIGSAINEHLNEGNDDDRREFEELYAGKKHRTPNRLVYALLRAKLKEHNGEQDAEDKDQQVSVC